MTTAMRWRVERHLARALVALLVLIGTRPALALTFDDRGEMRLGLRAYTAVRVGTETIGDSRQPAQLSRVRGGPSAPGPLLPPALLRPRPDAPRAREHGPAGAVPAAQPEQPQVRAGVPFRGRGPLQLGARGVLAPVRRAEPLPRRLSQGRHPGCREHDALPRSAVHQGAGRSAATQRAGAQPPLPRLPRLREGSAVHPGRPAEPRLGRDRHLPSPRQHQPARRQLRRLLHRARRAARAARDGPQQLPARLLGPLPGRVPRRLRRAGQPGRDQSRASRSAPRGSPAVSPFRTSRSARSSTRPTPPRCEVARASSSPPRTSRSTSRTTRPTSTCPESSSASPAR